MPLLQLYNKLLQFPLFIGMSREDLSNIVEHTRFEFSKSEKDKIIFKEGDQCNKLYFLTDGIIRIKKYADDNSYSIEEEVHAPYMFPLENLFGLTQRYSSTYQSTNVCNLIGIDKEEVMNLSDNFMIFKINLLNILSAQSQKLARSPWRKNPSTLRGMIVRFIKDRCSYPAGRKRVNILMTTLAKGINDGRLNVSRELNRMENENLLSLHRGGFDIPALERLLM